MLRYFIHVHSLAAEKCKINENNTDLYRNSDVKKLNYVNTSGKNVKSMRRMQISIGIVMWKNGIMFVCKRKML
jgi:hypothetical protein